MNEISPIDGPKRFVILDALRGFALLGICLANFPEFSLYTFQPPEIAAAMPSAAYDKIAKFFLYMLVDGKFYSIFSILFGIGFSIILSNALQKGSDGLGIFYRRMTVLAAIGFMHLMFLWSGDILLLYALTGMLLPFFRNMSNAKILAAAALLIAFPILMDALKSASGGSFDLAIPAIRAREHFNAVCGITEQNFPVWLRDAKSYPDVMRFLIPGAFERMQEFAEGNRPFKVLGLFLLGFYIGRNRIYAKFPEEKGLLKTTAALGFAVGLPLSAMFAWSATNEQPWGLPAHSALYAASVVPTALAYMAAACLLYLSHGESIAFKIFAAPGRMALTNYIGQSILGMAIFYGIGLGLGADTGLVYALGTALAVFAFQTLFSALWLKIFRFGPLEWVWRMLTYGKFLKILKQ